MSACGAPISDYEATAACKAYVERGAARPKVQEALKAEGLSK
jgi:hypothetical protein